MYCRIPVLQKLAGPSQEVDCAHICVYLCEQERRTVTPQHVLAMGKADEKGIGRGDEVFSYYSCVGQTRYFCKV